MRDTASIERWDGRGWELLEAQRAKALPLRSWRLARLVHNLALPSQLSLLVSCESFHAVDEMHDNDYPRKASVGAFDVRS